MIFEFLLAPATSEESARIVHGIQMNFEDSGKLSFLKNHIARQLMTTAEFYGTPANLAK